MGSVLSKAPLREIHRRDFANTEAAPAAGRIPWFAGTDPARGGRRDDQGRVQEQRLAALQHASARSLLREGLRGVDVLRQFAPRSKDRIDGASWGDVHVPVVCSVSR